MKACLVWAALFVALTSGSPSYPIDAAPQNPYLLTINKNGRVLRTPSLKAVFWGNEWHDGAFAGDIITGLDSLLAGYSGSQYAFTLTEYYDRTGPITPYATYLGYEIDSSPAPAPGGLTSSVAITKICSATNNKPDPNAAYFVFPSTPKAAGSPGSACGFHGWGACTNGKFVQVIGVPHTTGEIGSGCQGVQDTATGHSLALAQIANVAIHELAETITDPRGNGWRDSYGTEIGNKCIGTFPSATASYPVFTDGSVWKLQGVWSNTAYVRETGAANQSGQRACVW